MGVAGESGCGKSTDGHGPAAAPSGRHPDGRRDPARRRGRPRHAGGTSPGRPMGGRLHRLPGCTARAQSGAAHRRPDHRGPPGAQGQGHHGGQPAGAGGPAHPPGRCLPARAVRWAEAAGDDRHGTGLRSPPAHRRRADHRTRRDGAGPGAGAPGAHPGRAGVGDDLHHPRPLRPLVRGRPPRGDVRRTGRGGGPGRRRPRRSAAPVHPGPGRRVSDHRRLSLPVRPRRPPRRPAGSCRGAARLPVPPPLPGRHRRLPSTDVELRPVGDGDRRAACLLVPTIAGTVS